MAQANAALPFLLFLTFRVDLRPLEQVLRRRWVRQSLHATVSNARTEPTEFMLHSIQLCEYAWHACKLGCRSALTVVDGVDSRLEIGCEGTGICGSGRQQPTKAGGCAAEQRSYPIRLCCSNGLQHMQSISNMHANVAGRHAC